MADVFVSYSRQDAEFVNRLVGSITEGGRQVWVDTEGIADAEVFPDAIKRAIEGSDAFVFVISPASAHSPFCGNEVEYARDLQKRIVPVLREQVPDAELPAEIRDRNWIPFVADAEFGHGLDRLVKALDTDLAAARAHTRWLLKALEWEAEGRDHSFLLRGSELKAAEMWLASASEGSDPAPTGLQRAYLQGSRLAAARRQRTLLGTSVVVALVSLGLLVFALISRGQAVSSRVGARAQALAAESQAQLPNDPEISVILGVRAVKERATPQSIFALRAALDASPLELGLPTVNNPGSCGANYGSFASYSPDDRRIAVAACNGSLRLIDAGTARVLRRVNLGSGVASVAYSPDGSVLAAATNKDVELLNPESGAVLRHLTGARQASSLAFSPNGAILAADDQQGLTVWRISGGGPRILTHDQSVAGTLAFTRDGSELVAGGVDASVHVYDVADGRLVHRIRAPFSWPSWPEVVAVSPDGRHLAVGYPPYLEDGTGRVSLYSTATWHKELDVTTDPGVETSALAFSPDGTELAVGGEDGTAGVWSIATGQQLSAFDGPTAAVGSMQFNREGKSVLTSSNDGITRVWRSSGGEQAFMAFKVQAPDHVVVANGRVWVTSIANGSVYSSSLSGGPTRTLSLGKAGKATLSPDGRYALGSAPFGHSGPMTIWSTQTGKDVHRLPSGLFLGASFTYDDSRLIRAVGSPDGNVTAEVITDIATGRSVRLPVPKTGCGSPGQNTSISRDGRRVAAEFFCGTAVVWDAHAGHVLRTINQGAELSSVDLSPDGSRLLASSWDSRATIWDVASGKPLVSLVGHTRGIVDAAFSPDGTIVATGSLDHTVRLWDSRTGRQLRVLSFPDAQGPITFSPDGSRLAVMETEAAPSKPTIVRVFQSCPACRDARALLRLAAPALTSNLTTLERTVIGQS